MYMVEHVISVNCELGEGPLWDPRNGCLYWVDIMQNSIHKLNLSTNDHVVYAFGDLMCALAGREAGGYVVATKKHLSFWDGDSEALETICVVEEDLPNNRFNDAAVDPIGRFLVGTMNPSAPTGSLYALNADLTVERLSSDLSISNGMGWAPDNRTMYLTDSAINTIYSLDFDRERGTISNRQPFIQSEEVAGLPDGLTVDSEGFIWSAHWGGWNVTRFSPEGVVDRTIDIPVENVTSVAFGGDDLKTLFVTTARLGLGDEQKAKQPLAGDLFRAQVDIPGREEPVFQG